MKKTMKGLLVIAFAITLVMGAAVSAVAQPTGGARTVTLPRNMGGGTDWGNYQARITNVLPSGQRFMAGDSYTFFYTFKSNVAIDAVRYIYLLDNPTPDDKNWTPLSNHGTLQNIQANTEYSGTVSFNIVKDARSAAPESNMLLIETETGVASSPTLTFTQFVLVKNVISAGTTLTAYIPKNNNGEGYNVQFSPLPANTRVRSRETYTLNYTFKSDVLIESLGVVFADTRQQVNYWKELSDWQSLGDNIEPNKEYTGSLTITIKTNAGNATPEANRFVFSAGGEKTTRPPTLTFSNFSLTKN